MESRTSTSPDGTVYPLPAEAEYPAELARIERLVEQANERGQEIVVVMGLGFVGAVMAAIVADTTDDDGWPTKFVIGMQRPSTRSYWKIPVLNQGISPVKAEDPEVDPMIARVALEKKTFVATYVYDVLRFADCVIVDVQLDYAKNELGNVRNGSVEMRALEESFEIIAQRIKPDCLVLIETTVAPGTTEHVALPAMREIFRQRGIQSDPLLAHSYERVMPGRDYVASIRDFWRVCSGVNDEARRRVVKFLNEVLNTAEFPLTVLDRPIESETAKVMENSYRATILAFVDEWSLFAERNGVDITKVIRAIKMRPTHSNIMFPGPGIGGYCLPKDGGLGIWGSKHLLGLEDDTFKITPLAIDINDTRSLHAAELVRDALAAMGVPVAGAKVLLLGASYREDVGDTRYSGSEIIVRRLTEMGADLSVHDPYVDRWWEFESQDEYPSHSKAVFFKNQERLKGLPVLGDLDEALGGVQAVVLAVRHEQYLELDPDAIVKRAGGPIAVIDCFGILDDAKIRRYLELDCEVQGLGRGHVRRMMEEMNQERTGSTP